MNYLKHSLLNISKLITDARVRGNVGYIDYIYTDMDSDEHIAGIIYEKENVGVYIAEKQDWWDDDDYYDGYTYLYAKGIPEEDLHTIEETVKQMLKVRR